MMKFRKAFTLMEVNIAIMIMATGILSILGLYSLGFRENRQSVEDVASAAYADAVISPLIAALSSTNISWSAFNDIKDSPSSKGWMEYCNDDGIVNGNPENKARNVFSTVMTKMSESKVSAAWPSSASGGLKAGLVVMHKKDSATVKICFRASKQENLLLSSPFYYTEVRFQGDPSK